MIKSIFEKLKLYQNEIFLVMVIMFVGLISFGLGRLSAENKTTELNIKSTLLNTADLNKIVTDNSIKNKTVSNVQSPSVSKESSQPVVEGIDPDVAAMALPAQKIVGNKDSKVYHYENCAGALKMKEENKVYFGSIQEAKSAGFRPAGNCPGLE